MHLTKQSGAKNDTIYKDGLRIILWDTELRCLTYLQFLEGCRSIVNFLAYSALIAGVACLQ